MWSFALTIAGIPIGVVFGLIPKVLSWRAFWAAGVLYLGSMILVAVVNSLRTPLSMLASHHRQLAEIASVASPHKELEPKVATEVKPLQVEGPRVQTCTLSMPATIEEGDGYRALLLDVRNDPGSRHFMPLKVWYTSLIYYDSSGKAYLGIESGVWNGGDQTVNLDLAKSHTLILAIVDSSSGEPFIFNYGRDKEGDEALETVELKKGIGRVDVEFRYDTGPDRYSERLSFALRLGKQPSIKRIMPTSE
jgi:hypothetical protein